MTSVELEVLAADLPAFLDKVAAGETILIANHHRPLAELHPPTRATDTEPDEQELARRRKLLQEIDELRAEITRHGGVHPDSTPLIRETRDGRNR